MTYKDNITAILECNFPGFKQEIIDNACNRILGLNTKSVIMIPSMRQLPVNCHVCPFVVWDDDYDGYYCPWNQCVVDDYDGDKKRIDTCPLAEKEVS